MSNPLCASTHASHTLPAKKTPLAQGRAMGSKGNTGWTAAGVARRVKKREKVKKQPSSSWEGHNMNKVQTQEDLTWLYYKLCPTTPRRYLELDTDKLWQ